jgi:Zn-dependent peptidase ImmA (M78 family)
MLVSAPTITIGEYAERVADEYGVKDSSGRVDVRGLVRQLRGTVSASDGFESLTINHDGSFTIFVPLTTSPLRDNFTIAHELGHYFLHFLIPFERGDDPDRHFQRGGSSRLETQANVFAAALLMPEAEFRKAYRNLQGDVYAIASHFNVSSAAARVRASSLRLQ